MRVLPGAGVIELRWLLTDAQVPGTFSEPLEIPGRDTAFARLQYRMTGMFEGAVPWLEIPIVSELTEAPRIALVRPN